MLAEYDGSMPSATHQVAVPGGQLQVEIRLSGSWT